MTNFEIIEKKLKRFISKYYINELIRGIILFLSIGLLYFLFTVIIEHFLWLSPLGRTILFWLFIAVQAFLAFRFIGIPIARLTKLFSGIDFRDASTIIGAHFPEVSDKLVNVLQLHKNGGDDELTWASINQKSEALKPIPFRLAINFNDNKKYLKYLAIPVIIIAGLFFTGNDEVITKSASRVADYSNEYIPPAPFIFKVLNTDLTTLAQQDYKLNIEVTGRTLPENVRLFAGDKQYVLKQEQPGRYSYIFNGLANKVDFYLKANEVTSKNYTINVIDVPSITSLEMQLDYPAYIGKPDEVLKGTGNVLVPEGTKINWAINAAATSKILFNSDDKSISFNQISPTKFAHNLRIKNAIKYSIVTGNKDVTDYETLRFKVDVIKDDFPELDIEVKQDSIDPTIFYYKGQAADDYGLHSINLVYYDKNNPSSKKNASISKNAGTYKQFYYSFPGNLDLIPDTQYQYYFEVRDNDALNGFKVAKSEVYGFNKLSDKEQQDKELENQKESLGNLEKSLAEKKQQQQKLEQLQQQQLEQDKRGFNDKRKLEQLLEQQQKQDQKMRQQMERLRKNFDKSVPDENLDKKELEERMLKSEEELKKNEELLKELQKYQEKLSQEELQEQLEKTKKKSKQQQRNLEQLLELTKRLYVEQKYEQLSKELMLMGEEEFEESKKDSLGNKEDAQKKLNDRYEKWQQELEELEKENDQLKQPHGFEFDPPSKDDIEKDQKHATDKLQEKNNPEAQKKQKDAARKMMQQAQAMASQIMEMNANKMQEDADALRQILKNLIVFSKEQESLLMDTKELTASSPNFGKKLVLQKDLERAFNHIDDSLFSLASRNPKVGEKINKEITDIYYYLEKSLDDLAEFQIGKGQVDQQFTVKGANSLASLLNNAMDAMQNAISMPGKGEEGEEGQGSDPGFQLPDIIKGQESLSQGAKPGKEGESGESGESGKAGKSGKSGKSGQNGESGQDGQAGQDGKGGKNGKSGSGGEGGTGQSGKNGQGQSGNGQSGQGSSGQPGSGTQGGNSGSDGTNGKGANGDKPGDSDKPGIKQDYKQSETESARVYEIYKQQQQLRNQLENMIRQEGLEQKVNEITDQMKAVERKLLDQGFNREVQDKMMEIQHDLLKLKDASLKQGQEEKREANTSLKQFKNNTSNTPPPIDRYFNSKEILNRQVLPLQPQYRSKVKDYFKTK